uniref:Uncharacterized protein n=1 Tax=Photobacterium damselae subsp. damselae TaxID=85581 RepID=E4WL58_PHODD|nr:hypothetical protein [Photobacterium damselae subsp. damselae]
MLTRGEILQLVIDATGLKYSGTLNFATYSEVISSPLNMDR